MWDRSKEAPVTKTTSIRSAVSVELRLVTDTDRQCYGIYRASTASRSKKEKENSEITAKGTSIFSWDKPDLL